MFDKLVNADERGQVGIETLIIFIAMILVAAIAAGILINTAGFLQNKASATSEDSTEQVSNQVVVVTAIGEVNAGGNNITALNFTVMQAPGAEEIDLAEATIEWIGPDGHATLTFSSNSTSTLSVGRYGSIGVKDTDGSSPVLNSQDDRFVIHIPIDSTTGNVQRLNEGSQATLKFVTQSGSTFTYVVNVPESLSSDAGSSVAV